MKTYFAPAERATESELRHTIDVAANNAVIDAVMHSVCGLLAVLNPQRQILAVNDSLLKFLGIEDLNDILGLRPGEALHCVHCHETEGGCGTTRFCASCGAAIAIVTALAENQTTERLCAATLQRDDKTVDLCLRVRASPITVEGCRFIFLFLQDITTEQLWASMEASFFHDIINIINGLTSTANLLSNKKASQKANLPQRILQLAFRLANEVSIQRSLSHSEASNYHLDLQRVQVAPLLTRLQTFFATHPAARGKKLQITPLPGDPFLNTDSTLLERILTNMLLNAFEATEAGGEVRMWVEREGHRLVFSVWNRQPIPEEIQPRIFQRYFSTKPGAGRGLGTFSIKLFGERMLKGEADFSSSPERGTTFWLKLPLLPPPAGEKPG